MIPITDKESWARFSFLADWYRKRFKEPPSTENTPLEVEEGGYDHLELLEQCYKTKTKLKYEVSERFLH